MRALVAVLLLVPLTAYADLESSDRPCFVSTTGTDDAIGSATAPFATVKRALTARRPGERPYACTEIKMFGGTYAERIAITRSGTASRPLILTSVPGNMAVTIDVTNAPADPSPPGLRQYAIGIYDAGYVEVSNLRVTGKAAGACPIANKTDVLCELHALELRDNSNATDGPTFHHVTISDVEIFGVESAHDTNFPSVPLIVYNARDGFKPGTGTYDPDEVAHHIEIRRNYIHDCDTNSHSMLTDAVVLHRNIEDLLFENNTVEHMKARNPLALCDSAHDELCGDAFGMSGISTQGEVQSSTGPYDRPRRIVIRNNTFSDLDSNGVFVQAGHRTLIERNRIDHVLLHGVQVVTERVEAQADPFLRAQQIWIRDNLILDYLGTGVDLGMLPGVLSPTTYAPVQDVYVTNNTIQTTNTIGGRTDRYGIMLHQGVLGDSAIYNNVVEVTLDPAHAYPGIGHHLLYRQAKGAWPVQVKVDYNLWNAATPSGSTGNEYCVWTYAPVPDGGTFACQAFSSLAALGWEVNGIEADPKMTSAYRLNAGSPAIDAGRAAWAPAWADFGTYAGSELDGFGEARLTNGRVDIGWDER